MLEVGLVQNALRFLKSKITNNFIFVYFECKHVRILFTLWFMMSPEVMILKYHTDGYCSRYTSELHEYMNMLVFTTKACFPFKSLAKTLDVQKLNTKLSVLAKLSH